MKLSEIIAFMKAALEGTQKETTYYELVSDIQEVVNALEGGQYRQFFWIVSEKETFLTENGKKAADWWGNTPRIHCGYLITCNVMGTFAVKEL